MVSFCLLLFLKERYELMRIGFKIELNFHDLHKNLVYIDKCL